MYLLKFFGDYSHWYLVRLIVGILLCGIDGSQKSLYLALNSCYHYFHLYIRVITVHVLLSSIDLVGVFIKFIVNLIVVLEHHFALMLINDNGFVPWIVQGNINVNKFINIPLYVFPDRHMHQGLVKIGLEYILFSINIIFFIMMLSNEIDSHIKLMCLYFSYN